MLSSLESFLDSPLVAIILFLSTWVLCSFHHYLKVFCYFVLCVTPHCSFSEPTWLFLHIFPKEFHIISFPNSLWGFWQEFHPQDIKGPSQENRHISIWNLPMWEHGSHSEDSHFSFFLVLYSRSFCYSCNEECFSIEPRFINLKMLRQTRQRVQKQRHHFAEKHIDFADWYAEHVDKLQTPKLSSCKQLPLNSYCFHRFSINQTIFKSWRKKMLSLPVACFYLSCEWWLCHQPHSWVSLLTELFPRVDVRMAWAGPHPHLLRLESGLCVSSHSRTPCRSSGG